MAIDAPATGSRESYQRVKGQVNGFELNDKRTGAGDVSADGLAAMVAECQRIDPNVRGHG